VIRMAHLQFDVIEEKPKTKVYSVISSYDGSNLGQVRWYSYWRCYIFQPRTDCETVWSDDCLNELQNFIRGLMEERKAKRLSDSSHTLKGRVSSETIL
jgi:hypothetical protein